HATGLRAFAAIGGPSAQRLAGEALTGVGDAQRTVDENFQRQLWVAGCGLVVGWPIRTATRNPQIAARLPSCHLNLLDLFQRTFAGEHDEIATEFAGEFDAASAGYGHLRRGMNREIRRELANPAAYSHVLHDGGVHSGRNDGAQVLVSL